MKTRSLAIKLQGVTKTYRLHHEKPTLIENLMGRDKGETFVALDGVSFEIESGEKVGLVGANGSGKTTLLKLISGIATPNKGKIKTWGKVVSLIDLGAGFHPELSGLDNIYQNAMLLGMMKKEVITKLEEIISFADIGEFIDAPMYTYSSGMQLRLGFSIAVAAEPDILILDEGIAVGDENFQKKSVARVNQIIAQGKTILIASHWIKYLRDNCSKILWLSNGKIVEFGGVDLLDAYEQSSK